MAEPPNDGDYGIGVLANANPSTIDHGVWDTALKKIVASGEINGIELNVVDYEAVRNGDVPEVGEYIKSLEDVDLSSLSDTEKKVLLINAYNALAVQTVAKSWPVKSIRDIGSWLRPVWKKVAGNIGGSNVSLDQVETSLRNMGDPRIHASINCASVSCPDLQPSAFKEGSLDAQLDEAFQKWMLNDRKGHALDTDNKKLTLSMIFSWFSGDFEKKEGSVLNFVTRFLSEDHAKFVKDNEASISLAYFDYDWSVNAKSRTLGDESIVLI